MIIHPDWEQIGDPDPASRLLTTIQVNNCLILLEARQITYVEGQQAFIDYPEDLESLHALYGLDATGFQTMTHEGREYILFATPFSA